MGAGLRSNLIGYQWLHEPPSQQAPPEQPSAQQSCAFGVCVGDFVAEYPTATAANRATLAMM
jgi:hypothetical protein